ncbi:Zinc finger, RING-type [Kalmanozyma brasiliensis GHG001]|uniref:Zinc finger, RING-type n=1 Tax=Kalmanozyma brasiliensis (strain GHG001) TaxID=1365824 RepID=UPI001CE8829F|nr:Zinc finger, RING-type [Kalmanozyma brasiliensis GHG001]EST07319.2 Zinc finger, RING-type [Kalmanozyma brasiliensis GHG001]
MGHSQSRQQPSGSDEAADEHAGPSRSYAHDDHPPSQTNDAANGAGSRRKRRRRDSASWTQSSAEHASQRRRTSPRLASAPPAANDTPATNPESHQPSTQTTGDAMDIDASEAQSSIAAPPVSSDTPVRQVQPPPSDLQQRFAVVQSQGDTSPRVGDGSTPPPHLDPLRDERERARRRILETLGAAPPSAASAPSSSGNSTAAPASSSAAPLATNASASPSPASASATIAALLGAVATSTSPSQANNRAAAPAPPDAALPTATTTPQTSPPQQQRPQTARPHAFRVPLQPEMISGTSMVVQGALVARTVANRANSPNPAMPARPSQPNTAQGVSSSASSPTPLQPETVDRTSTGGQNHFGVPGATLEGDNLRGAVTLEEQAVMLSRILGIAAAATAASLLNTADAQQVDPSLLQTSLRRPFERMNQQTGDGNDRWLADWQRGGSNQPSSSGSSSGAQLGTSTTSDSGNGLRGRLAALSRRVQSASSSSGLPSARQEDGSASSDSSSATAGSSATPTAGSASTARPPGGTSEGSQASRQQEIIAHLLSAAEREATSQRLTRLRSADQPTTSTAAVSSDTTRSTSFSASRPLANRPQQDPPRSTLSRLVRSTIGSLMRPSRLLSGRSAQTDDTQSSGAQREGWSRGSAGSGGSGRRTIPTSDFSLGPNDVAGSLRQVRNGILPDGVPGSFGSFLNHLVNDLMAAVQLMQPSSGEAPEQPGSQPSQTTNYFEHATQSESTSGAEVLDGEASAAPSSTAQPAQAAATASIHDARSDAQSGTGEGSIEAQAARQRDFQNGNLSFFRLFRFDPIAPSQLVPCIVVGVRSLNVTERFGEEMTGAQAPGPGRDFNGSRQQTSRPTTLGRSGPTAPPLRQRASSEGAPASAPPAGETTGTNEEELPASRFMLFVSGGRYPPNHPLLTSNPTTAGRDLMILMDLLSTMQAMQHKPATVTQQEIDASELKKIKGSEVAAMVRDGKITENMLERCLVCLEEWGDDDTCRLLACRHAFHTGCVDRWMTSSSNTCPMCRRQGVSKDGRQAGAETADSQRAAQA